MFTGGYPGYPSAQARELQPKQSDGWLRLIRPIPQDPIAGSAIFRATPLESPKKVYIYVRYIIYTYTCIYIYLYICLYIYISIYNYIIPYIYIYTHAYLQLSQVSSKKWSDLFLARNGRCLTLAPGVVQNMSVQSL